jgi:hypothetical protein
MTVVVPTPSSTSNLNSSIGLRLDLALSVNSSGGATVTADIFNTFNRVNNITAKEHWPIDPSGLFLWVQGYCGPPPGVPIGYAVFRGNYGQDNFTMGTPLSLEAQSQLSCPYEAPTQYYAFKPLSDVATANERDNVPGLAGLYNVTVDTACHWTPGDCWWSGLGTWSGYWTGSASQSGAGFVTGGACPSGQVSSSSNPVQASSGCPLVFNQFPPGVYTVVAADEWGQVAVLHFTVAS